MVPSTTCLLPTLSFLFFLSCAIEALYTGDQGDQEDFLKRCPPRTCGAVGSPEIRYPLRLDSSPTSCGAAGLVLSCSGALTLLPFPSLPTSFALSVVAINYSRGFLIVKLEGSSWSRCLLQSLSLLDFSASSFDLLYSKPFSVVNCSQRIPLSGGSSDGDFVGPISCLGGASDFMYATDSYAYMDSVPPYCVMISASGWIPYMDFQFDLYPLSLASIYDAFAQRRQMIITMRDIEFSNKSSGYSEIGKECAVCEFGGGRCGFSQKRNQSFCYNTRHHSKNVKLIVGTSVGGGFLVLLVSCFFIMHRRTENEEEMQMKIERFLVSYKNTNPTRYSYSDVKKMTMRFKQILGQGGFGSVYKGVLPSGIPVAVKMIENSISEGSEFINEVATIGRIHHVNVVRLLGFCSEGNRRALVYEFMPNESLDKFIFPKGKHISQHISMEKLQEIAIGIAQGIEYLHQGCDQRILHFDIKPHNILLDQSLVPKISDFGMAKLCPRDQSMITMTAARGTMGYIAPEMYCRNFGNVSYKSDVYSFGMLLLEMVSGRKHADPCVENQSATYFPEWIYEQLVKGVDIGLVFERRGHEVEIAKKLLVVSLWCIQWNPVDRPTMSRVVQMLVGEVQELEIPPNPFVSSSGIEWLTCIDVL